MTGADIQPLIAPAIATAMSNQTNRFAFGVISFPSHPPRSQFTQLHTVFAARCLQGLRSMWEIKIGA